MKIKTQLTASAIGIATIAVVNAGAVFYESDKAAKAAKVVNYAGIVRGGTQRIVKKELVKQPVEELIAKIDGVVEGLLNGDAELGIAKMNDPVFMEKMMAVDAAWEKVQNLIQRHRIDSSLDPELLKASEELYEATNEAVFAAEAIAEKRTQELKYIEVAILLLTIGLAGAIYYVNYRISGTLKGFTDNLAVSSNQISATMNDQEKTIAEQASSVNETTTTVEELGATSRQTAQQADVSSQGARQALDLSEKGTESAGKTMAGINDLHDKVTAIADQIVNLSEQTAQISGISELVSDVANQTNMLALNAAVEAARAGEQGKGFTVVADEIRKLAEQSKKSAEKINSLVDDIQSAINSTIMVTDLGQKQALEGIELAQDSADKFQEIADAVNNVFVNSQQISMSSKQQAVAVQQVISAMNAINLGAQETTSGVGQVKSAAGRLKQEANDLKELV